MRPLTAIVSNFRIYLVLNLLLYGWVICGMVFGICNQQARTRLVNSINITISHASGLNGAMHQSYKRKDILSAIPLTFANNTFNNSFLLKALPSLIFPFAGTIISMFEDFHMGVWIAPKSKEMLWRSLREMPTLILEAQADVLISFGGCLIGKWTLFPKISGFETRRRGYIEGVKAMFSLYWLIIPILLIAATYEGFEVIYFR